MSLSPLVIDHGTGDLREMTTTEVTGLLPDQTGQNGKFLKTDGAAASWQPAVGKAFAFFAG